MHSRMLTLLILLFNYPAYPGTLQYTPSFDRATPIATWPAITVTDLDLGIRTWSTVSANDVLSVTVFIASDQPVSTNRYYAGYSEVYKFPCNRFDGVITCDGVYLGRIGEDPVDSDVKAAALHLLGKSPRKYVQYAYYTWPKDYCSVGVTVNYGGTKAWTWNHGDGGCTVGPNKPDPVSCKIVGPSTLTHPTQHSDLVGGTIGEQWRVSCTGATAVNVATTRVLDLYSGRDHITSGLYVERVGSVEKDIDVDQSTDVYIISRLETTAALPGEYLGSGIITISWY